jgi:hypothetical protein
MVMPERTKRGEEEHKREDEELKGEPVGTATTGEVGNADGHATNTTRDKGVEPSKDARRDGRGVEED